MEASKAISSRGTRRRIFLFGLLTLFCISISSSNQFLNSVFLKSIYIKVGCDFGFMMKAMRGRVLSEVLEMWGDSDCDCRSCSMIFFMHLDRVWIASNFSVVYSYVNSNVRVNFSVCPRWSDARFTISGLESSWSQNIHMASNQFLLSFLVRKWSRFLAMQDFLEQDKCGNIMFTNLSCWMSSW